MRSYVCGVILMRTLLYFDLKTDRQYAVSWYIYSFLMITTYILLLLKKKYKKNICFYKYIIFWGWVVGLVVLKKHGITTQLVYFLSETICNKWSFYFNCCYRKLQVYYYYYLFIYLFYYLIILGGVGLGDNGTNKWLFGKYVRLG